MTGCARGCTRYRRHLPTCPVEDRHGTAMVPAPADLDRDPLFDGDQHLTGRKGRAAVYIGHYGGLEVEHVCRGCVPRPAEHGVLCDQCHTRLVAWFTGAVQDRVWRPGMGSVAWAWDWIAADREPAQTAAGADRIRQGKKVPPAALALHVTDLRDDLCKGLGSWLRAVTAQFDLDGPAWWAYRVDHRPDSPESWRSWLPKTGGEVVDAQRYLFGWLGRVEDVADLVVTVYAEAERLVGRVAGLAPWEASARRLPGLECPECGRGRLARFEGDEHLTCLGCDHLVTRARYDRWTELLRSERAS